MTQLPVDAITVGERRRDEYGDVAVLVASIIGDGERREQVDAPREPAGTGANL